MQHKSTTRDDVGRHGKTPEGIDGVNEPYAPWNTPSNDCHDCYSVGWNDGWNEALKAANAAMKEYIKIYPAIPASLLALRTGPAVSDPR